MCLPPTLAHRPSSTTRQRHATLIRRCRRCAARSRCGSRTKRIGAPVRFYDPTAATFSSLTAPGVQTDAVTHLTVHNLTASPVVVTPTLREATVQTPKEVWLPGVLLAPYASQELAVNTLFSKMLSEGVERATFTLGTSAPLGALVGALTQIGNKDGLIEDIPLRTANPPAYARGAYPLRWDQDYTNLVTVTNTADTSRSLRGL